MRPSSSDVLADHGADMATAMTMICETCVVEVYLVCCLI